MGRLTPIPQSVTFSVQNSPDLASCFQRFAKLQLYYGVLGDYCRAVAEHVEADPVGILACLLCGVGSILGRQCYHEIGRRHAANLFVLLIGSTGFDRKGTCWDCAELLLTLADSEWAANCIEGGFGSGEGLIWRIRDARGDDEGIADKRLLIVEEEFAKPLRLCKADTSILSQIIRTAYDGKPLTKMNRSENAYQCREPHISVIGMATEEELAANLKGRTHLHDGFLNRFLLVDVNRQRYLSRGSPWREHAPTFAGRLKSALERFSGSALTIADDAADYWDGEYRRLEERREGEYGLATCRLSVHTLKVALIYAALDGERAIRLRHLKAALAFIAVADATATRLFPGATEPPPEPQALLVLAQSRPDGITRTDAHRLFSNKRKAEEIDGLFRLLTPAYGDWHGERWYVRANSDTGGCAGGNAVANSELANSENGGQVNSPFADSQGESPRGSL